jgi:hypothetical protein
LTTAWWTHPVVAWGWQVILHSTVATAALALWSRRLGMPSGRPRRLLLVTVLALPLLTAALPGRASEAFRDQVAWLDSARILALPLPVGGWQLWHAAVVVAALATVAAVVQELAPVLSRPPRGGPAPPALLAIARTLPGWHAVRVDLSPSDEISLATGGRPGRPSLTVTRGALDAFGADELAAALAHENAHWRRGRWWTSHLLFAVRLIQPFNPVALWSFREYLVETEIACDRDAVAAGEAGDGAGDPTPLARALVRVYESTDPRETSARGVLRRRVDALLGRLPVADDRPPVSAVAAAAVLLALVLPWLV